MSDVRLLLGGAGAAYRLARSAAMFLNAEEKSVLVSLDGSLIGTAVTVTLLNGIAQGLDQNQRTGNSLKMTALQWRLDAAIAVAATYTILRHIIVFDTQVDGVSLTTTDLLTPGITSVAHTIVPNVVTAPQRFVIVHDETICLDLNGDGNRSTHGLFSFQPWGAGAHVLNKGTSAVVGDISKGALYSVLVSTEGTNKPAAYAQYRLFYLDN